MICSCLPLHQVNPALISSVFPNEHKAMQPNALGSAQPLLKPLARFLWNSVRVFYKDEILHELFLLNNTGFGFVSMDNTEM